MLTLIDRNGPPEAITCPAFLCEVCREPVTARNGLVVWEVKRYVDRRPELSDLWTVHQGRCDRAWESHVGRHLMSRRLDQFVQELMHNVTKDVFDEPEEGAEYVAPAPSTWTSKKR